MRPCRDYATANVSREGRAWTLLAIHVTAVQQIAGFWLLPIRVQEGRGASAAQETRARRHPDEKLHAEAAGENRIYIQSRLQTSLDDNSLMSKTQTVGVPPH